MNVTYTYTDDEVIIVKSRWSARPQVDYPPCRHDVEYKTLTPNIWAWRCSCGATGTASKFRLFDWAQKHHVKNNAERVKAGYFKEYRKKRREDPEKMARTREFVKARHERFYEKWGAVHGPKVRQMIWRGETVTTKAVQEKLDLPQRKALAAIKWAKENA